MNKGNNRGLELSGKRFGKLVAIRLLGVNKHKQRIWECICDCGKTTISIASKLQQNRKISCGCSAKDWHRLPPGWASRNEIYGQYRGKANRRNISFLLSMEEFESIATANCYYCGRTPSNIRARRGQTPFPYNGIDRVDNSRGYERGNVVPCCRQCNYAKNEYPINEFKDWIRRAYNFWARKEV